MVKSQPLMRYLLLRVVPAMMVAVTLSACGTTSNRTTAKQDSIEMHAVKNKNSSLLQASQDEFEALVKNTDIKDKLLTQYTNWKGVRYRFGGTNKSGIDCSAFVQVTFREQFGIDLPRSTSGQQHSGQSVKSKTKLRVGDLVLFRSGPTGRHVGIYVGNNKFVHASTSSGVVISDLDENYWRNRFQEARRVLDSKNIG